MRDISRKVRTLRTALAEAVLIVSPEIVRRIREGSVPKGDPLPVAKIAAIQAAKHTSRIIPYCHPLEIEFVGVDFHLSDTEIRVLVEAKATYKTGVEMEAMTGASVAALTLYDMLKMLDEDMEISQIRLLEKRGGKSDFSRKKVSSLRAAVLVMSDTIAQGKKEDASGKLIVQRLQDEGLEVAEYRVIPDEKDLITQTIKRYADDMRVDLVVTTGGTGLSPRDTTPEAVDVLLERRIPGIAETIRAYGQERMPYSMLSRSIAGLRGNTLIVTLPGSRGGVSDSLDALFPALLHAFSMMRAGGHHAATHS